MYDINEGTIRIPHGRTTLTDPHWNRMQHHSFHWLQAPIGSISERGTAWEHHSRQYFLLPITNNYSRDSLSERNRRKGYFRRLRHAVTREYRYISTLITPYHMIIYIPCPICQAIWGNDMRCREYTHRIQLKPQTRLTHFPRLPPSEPYHRCLRWWHPLRRASYEHDS